VDELGVLQEMEPLARRFRASPWLIFMTTFLLLGLELFIGAALPFESLAFRNAIVFIVAVTLLGALCALFTRLELKADDDLFKLIVSVFGIPVIHRSARGSSWHVVTRSGRYYGPTTEPTSFSRVEVADCEGNRVPIMGELLAFFFGVECL
jgi:hypothetical protein